MLVKDVMTHEPLACDPHITADRAVRLMQDHNIGFLPVVKNIRGYIRLAGVVTDRDLCLRVLGADLQPHKAPIELCLTPDPIACKPTDTLEAALSLMDQHQVRRLPVVDNSDRLMGVITLSDIARSKLVDPEILVRTLRRVNCRKKTSKVLAFSHAH
jgi:CBS domain-containing protein